MSTGTLLIINKQHKTCVFVCSFQYDYLKQLYIYTYPVVVKDLDPVLDLLPYNRLNHRSDSFLKNCFFWYGKYWWMPNFQAFDTNDSLRTLVFIATKWHIQWTPDIHVAYSVKATFGNDQQIIMPKITGLANFNCLIQTLVIANIF